MASRNRGNNSENITLPSYHDLYGGCGNSMNIRRENDNVAALNGVGCGYCCVGPQGPAGVTATNASVFIYNTGEQEIADNAAVFFGSSPVPNPVPPAYSVFENGIVVNMPGLYCATYRVISQLPSIRFELWANGVALPGSAVFSSQDDSFVLGQILFSVTAVPTTIQLVNVSGIAVNLQTNAAANGVNASLIIAKFA